MSLEVLKQYLAEFGQASDIEEKWLVAQKYQGKHWMFDIPMIAGEYVRHYWVIDERTGDLGRVTLAIPVEDEGAMKRITAKTVDDYGVLSLTGAALVMSK